MRSKTFTGTYKKDDEAYKDNQSLKKRYYG